MIIRYLIPTGNYFITQISNDGKNKAAAVLRQP